jgi:hypothetical protein
MTMYPSPGLEDLIGACLAKAPGERPASALELRARLLAIDLKTPWTEDRGEAWWKDEGASVL